MAFNKGFICALCGPIEKAKTKTVKKIPYNICPECMGFVEVWERPLNERPGRCANCGEASFKQAIVKSHLLRHCKKCSEVCDIDADKIIRKGKAEFRYVNDRKN